MNNQLPIERNRKAVVSGDEGELSYSRSNQKSLLPQQEESQISQLNSISPLVNDDGEGDVLLYARNNRKALLSVPAELRKYQLNLRSTYYSTSLGAIELNCVCGELSYAQGGQISLLPRTELPQIRSSREELSSRHTSSLLGQTAMLMPKSTIPVTKTKDLPTGLNFINTSLNAPADNNNTDRLLKNDATNLRRDALNGLFTKTTILPSKRIVNERKSDLSVIISGFKSVLIPVCRSLGVGRCV